MMKHAGAIIRVSTARQLDGTSPEKQLEAIEALATRQNYSIDKKHIWQTAESGSLKGEMREGFQNALQACRNGDVSRLYVFSMDRLGRDLIEMLLFLRDIHDLNVDCWAADTGQQLLHDDLMVMILGAVASNERKQILARMTDGKHRAVDSKRFQGGQPLYGYKVNPETKRVEIDEEEAVVVRMIFHWYIDEHLSALKIAERLNSLHLRPRYSRLGRKIKSAKPEIETAHGLFTQAHISRILLTKSYYGYFLYGINAKKMTGVKEIEGYYPPIISEEIYNQARNVSSRNSNLNKRHTVRKYLLRGMIKCGYCNRMFSAEFSTTNNNYYYSCLGRRRWHQLGLEKQCENAELIGPQIEAVVWDDVKYFCKNPQIIFDEYEEKREAIDETLNIRIQEANTRLVALKNEERNILKLAIASQEVDTIMLDSFLVENHSQQEAMQKYVDALKDEAIRTKYFESELADVTKKLNMMARYVDEATYEEKREILELLVKEISVTYKKVPAKRKKNIYRLVPVVKVTYKFNESDIDLKLPAFPIEDTNIVINTQLFQRLYFRMEAYWLSRPNQNYG